MDWYYTRKYKDSQIQDFYVEKDTSGLVHLSQYKFITYRKDVYGDERDYIRETNTHVGKLLFLFQDCPSLQNKITSCRAERKSLIRVVEAYNKCGVEAAGQNKYVSDNSSRKAHWSLDGGVGVDGAKLKYYTNAYYVNSINEAYNGIEFGVSVNPVYGLFATATLPYVSNRLSIRFGMTYSNWKHEGNATGELWGGAIINDYSLSINIKQFSFPVLFGYNFPTTNSIFHPFVEVGMYNAVIKGKLISSGSDRSYWLKKHDIGFLANLGTSVDIGNRMFARTGIYYGIGSDINGTVFQTTRYQHFGILAGLGAKFRK